jgi:hypothetical protein
MPRLSQYCLALLFAAPAPAQTVRTFEGDALALKGGDAVLYTEQYRDTLRDGRPHRTGTHYFDAEGRPIADRVMDFSRHAWKPDYRLVDRRDGYEEGAEVSGRTIRVFYRAKRGRPLKEKNLSVPEPAVIDGGFNRFIKDHWEALSEGRPVPFNFVAPSQLDYFAFEAVKTSDGGGRITFAVRPANKVVRVLVDPIQVTYDAATRRMTRYSGLSNINDAKGKSLKVRLVYPDLGP